MKRLVSSILMLLPLGAIAGEIYRSVDENGVVEYSDRPSADAEQVAVNTAARPAGRPASVPASPPAAASSGADSSDSAPEGPIFAEVAREPTPEERASNCTIAQERAATYSTAQRLFRTDADGERIYLTDAELDDVRATAESDVATWCD